MQCFNAAKIRSPGKYLSGYFAMLLGPVLVFGMVLVMNRMGSDHDQNKAISSTEINMVKQEKPKPKKQLKKPEQKPKTRRARAPAPLLQLNTGLSGIDLGLGVSDLDGDSLINGDNKLLGNTQASAMTEDSVDTLPQPKVKTAFVYPRAAKKSGTEGYVLFSLLIDIDGSVSQAQVLESSPPGVFDDSAMTGIKNWRFVPAQYQGKAVKVWVKQRIRFGFG